MANRVVYSYNVPDGVRAHVFDLILCDRHLRRVLNDDRKVIASTEVVEGGDCVVCTGPKTKYRRGRRGNRGGGAPGSPPSP